MSLGALRVAAWSFDNDAMDIGTVIKSRRIERGLKLEALAFDASVSASTLSRIERGKLTPSLDTLYRLAEALELPVSTLFLEAEHLAGTRASQQLREVTDAYSDESLQLRQHFHRLDPHHRQLALAVLSAMTRVPPPASREAAD